MSGRASSALLMAVALGSIALLGSEPPPGVSPGQVAPVPSIHQREHDAHARLALPPGPAYPLEYTVKPGAMEEGVPESGLTKTVYGFMPYWVVSDLSHVRWDLLSHVAYFSVDVSSTGSLTNQSGSYAWPSGAYVQALLSAAHANGVKVTLAATNFTPSSQTTLLSSATYRQNAINNLLSLVQNAGGDGVNIDFEALPSAQYTNFVTFMTDLTAAFHGAIPGSHVTCDTPAVDWSGAFNYSQLAANTDGLFIMAYDYHWSSDTTAGPCSPLTGGSTWGTYTVTWTVNDYFTHGGSGNAGKYILGLPYYGYEWPTSSTSVPSSATATGTSKTYNVATANASTYGRLWDAASQTPYYLYSSSGAHQGWYDDAQSLGAKWDLVNTDGLGGTGMWALNYDTADSSLWDALAARFATNSGNLAGIKIGVDPGHGGTDPGANGPTGLLEKDVNLGTSLLLRDALQAAGASVYMTRTTDVAVDLTARTDYFNSIPVDRAESCHYNACGTCGANYTGVHVYADSSGTCLASATSKDMAAKTALRLDAALQIGVVSSNCDGIYGVHGDNFAMVRQTAMPAMLTESSFIDNAQEEQLLYDDPRRCTIAGAIAKGIEDHYGVGATDAPCAGAPLGTCGNPIAIGSFPYSDSNTTLGKTAAMNAYSCAPTTNEAGPEVVYTFSLALAGTFTASVTDGTGVDIDVHLLTACSPSSCIARNDTALSAFLQPGTYTLVCDTWTSSGGTQYAGAYTLSANFQADTTAPATVQNLRWNKTSTRWEWDAVTTDRLGGAETMGTYQVWRATAPGGTFTLLSGGLTAANYADASAPGAGTCWYYFVHAVDAAGNRDGARLDWTQGYLDAAYSAGWGAGSNADCSGGTGAYRYANTGPSTTSTATWSFGPDESGTYTVYARFVQGTNRTTAARYTVEDLSGSTLSTVNQQSGGCTWVSLGSHTLKAGQVYAVVLDSKEPASFVVIADSVRWAK